MAGDSSSAPALPHAVTRQVCSLTICVADNAHAAGRVGGRYTSSVVHNNGETTLGVTAAVVDVDPLAVWIPGAILPERLLRVGDVFEAAVNHTQPVRWEVRKTMRLPVAEALPEADMHSLPRGWDAAANAAGSHGPGARARPYTPRLREDQSRRAARHAELHNTEGVFNTARLAQYWRDAAAGEKANECAAPARETESTTAEGAVFTSTPENETGVGIRGASVDAIAVEASVTFVYAVVTTERDVSAPCGVPDDRAHVAGRPVVGGSPVPLPTAAVFHEVSGGDAGGVGGAPRGVGTPQDPPGAGLSRMVYATGEDAVASAPAHGGADAGYERAVYIVAYPFCSATSFLGAVVAAGVARHARAVSAALTARSSPSPSATTLFEVHNVPPLPGTAGGVVLDARTLGVIGIVLTGTSTEVAMQSTTAVAVGDWCGLTPAEASASCETARMRTLRTTNGSPGAAPAALLPRPNRPVVAAAARCVFCVKMPTGRWGSAVSLGGGWFITNAHVVGVAGGDAATRGTTDGGAREVGTGSPGGTPRLRHGDRWVDVDVVYASRGSVDVALLRLRGGASCAPSPVPAPSHDRVEEVAAFPAMPLAGYGSGALGEPVAVIGYARSSDAVSVTYGVVSALLPQAGGAGGAPVGEDDTGPCCIVTSAATSPGVSGGALVSLRTGRCLGLPTACVYCPTLQRLSPLGMVTPVRLCRGVLEACNAYTCARQRRVGGLHDMQRRLAAEYDVVLPHVDAVWQLAAPDTAADALLRLQKQIAAVRAGLPTAAWPPFRKGARLLNYIHAQRAHL